MNKYNNYTNELKRIVVPNYDGKQYEEYFKEISTSYVLCNLTGSQISVQKESELKDRFIRFYCKFDKRLKRIKREKISVSPIKNGGVRLSLVAWGKCYGQFYEV